MAADSYALFDDALDNFLRSAPPGTRPTVIGAGERECADFRDWLAHHPSGSRMPSAASFSGRGAVVGYYGDLPIERAATGSYLCIIGQMPDGATIECPEPVSGGTAQL